MVTTEPTSLAFPLRWTGSDFASASGPALLLQKVRHVLLSEGEMPWRTALRVALDQLRHRRADVVTSELVRVRVRDALNRWLPEVVVTRLDVMSAGNSLQLHLDVREGDVAASGSFEVA